MNLLKENVFTFIYLYTILPGLAYSLQFNNIVITRYAVGPAIDVIGCDYGVNHLHKSSRSLDFASDSSFSHCLVGWNFFAISDIRMFAFCRVDYGVSSTRGFTP